jgi:hypothetical protein
MFMSIEKFLRDTQHWSPEEMRTKHTRQLLNELRRMNYAYEYDWTEEDIQAVHEYRIQLKAELATREHIPNKIESKAIRKARKKKGN